MSLEELKLTLNPGELDESSYRISMIQVVDVSSRKDAFSLAPPGLAASDNILLGVSGMQADISIRFMAHDDGTDKSDGTHSSTVVSLEDQLTYLEDVIHAPDFGASWELDHLTGAAFNADEVFLETVDAPFISRESPKWREVRLGLRRGGSVA